MRVWNRIPDAVRRQVIALALERPELSSRELAVTYTDERGCFFSEASVYRLLRAQDLIGTPAFRVMTAADEIRGKTSAPNQLWQTDFTYLTVIGWGWFYMQAYRVFTSACKSSHSAYELHPIALASHLYSSVSGKAGHQFIVFQI